MLLFFSVLLCSSITIGYVSLLGADLPSYQYIPLHTTIQTKNNSFTKIPEDITGDTSEVIINNHNITTIDSGSFKTLTSCLKLNLNKNQIVEIQPDAFKAMLKLEILLLRYNHMVKLGSTTFNGFKRIKKIDISNNKIQTINPNSFFVQSKMIMMLFSSMHPEVTFVLNGNRLATIHNHTFYGVFSLVSLILNFNRISHIDTSAFNSNEKLSKIHLIGNRLTSIRKEIFHKLPLVELDLSNNRITTIQPGSFASMSNGNLFLQDNNVTSLAWDLFISDMSTLSKKQITLKRNYVNGNNLSSSQQVYWIFHGWNEKRINITSSPFNSLTALECARSCATQGT